MEGNLLNCNSQPFEVVEMDVPAGVKGEEVVMFWVGGWGWYCICQGKTLIGFSCKGHVYELQFLRVLSNFSTGVPLLS